MNKKIFFIIIPIITILILVVVFFQYQQLNEEPVKEIISQETKVLEKSVEEQLRECEEMEQIEKDACYKNVAINKKNSTICERIIVENKDNCYILVAMAKQDSIICEKAQNQIYKSWCVKTIQREPLIPEEVAIGFLHEYLFLGVPLEKSNLVTEEYKKKIAKIKEEMILVDPVIFAQDFPSEIIVERAEISKESAFLTAILKYSASNSYNLKIELLLINDKWKINNIRYEVLPEKNLENETANWVTYRNEKFGFKLKHPPYATISLAENDSGFFRFIFNFDNDFGSAGFSWIIQVYKMENLKRNYYRPGENPYNGGICITPFIYDIVQHKWRSLLSFQEEAEGREVYTEIMDSCDNILKVKKTEYTPPKVYNIVVDGFSLIKGGEYFDVGMGSEWYSLINKDKNLIIEFVRTSDGNSLDLTILEIIREKLGPDAVYFGDHELLSEQLSISKRLEEINNKLNRDFPLMLSTFRFID